MPFSLEYGEGLFEEVTLKLWLEGQERTGHSCYKGNAPRRENSMCKGIWLE